MSEENSHPSIIAAPPVVRQEIIDFEEVIAQTVSDDPANEISAFERKQAILAQLAAAENPGDLDQSVTASSKVELEFVSSAEAHESEGCKGCEDLDEKHRRALIAAEAHEAAATEWRYISTALGIGMILIAVLFGMLGYHLVSVQEKMVEMKREIVAAKKTTRQLLDAANQDRVGAAINTAQLKQAEN